MTTNPPERPLQRLVRRFVPTWHHQSGYPKQPVRVEYWSGDDRFRASVHLHWNCLGRAQWLCVFLPEWPWPNKDDLHVHDRLGQHSDESSA